MYGRYVAYLVLQVKEGECRGGGACVCVVIFLPWGAVWGRGQREECLLNPLPKGLGQFGMPFTYRLYFSHCPSNAHSFIRARFIIQSQLIPFHSLREEEETSPRTPSIHSSSTSTQHNKTPYLPPFPTQNPNPNAPYTLARPYLPSNPSFSLL